MLNLAAISGLTVISTFGAILLIVTVWLIIKIILKEPDERKSKLDTIRKRYFKGEIEDESFDDRLHHMI